MFYPFDTPENDSLFWKAREAALSSRRHLRPIWLLGTAACVRVKAGRCPPAWAQTRFIEGEVTV